MSSLFNQLKALRETRGAVDTIKGIRATDGLLTSSGVTGLVALLKALPSMTEVRVSDAKYHARSFMSVFLYRARCGVIFSVEILIPPCSTHQLDISNCAVFGPESAKKLGEILHPRLKLSLANINLSRCPIKDQGVYLYWPLDFHG